MPPRKRKVSPTLERKIYFYRAEVGTDEHGAPLPFDPKPTLATILQLPFTDEGGRYFKGLEGEEYCAWVDDHQGEHPKMRFGLIRRAGLPQVEESGTLTDLNLATRAGLAESIHVVFFPNNIVGIDFNFHGPRLSRLATYMQMKCDGAFCGTFSALLRNDVLAQLDRLSDIRLFDLKIRTSFAGRVAQADEDLGSAFEAARRMGDTKELAVSIRPDKGGQTSMLDRLRQAGRSIATIMNFRDEASKFQICGKCEDSGKVEPIDLLRDQLISKKQIVRLSERGRALDKDSAYGAIIAAHTELSPALSLASSASL